MSTALVTGGNAGIGRATAAGLARRGQRVVILCRDEGRAKEARDALRFETGGEVEYVLGDLARPRDAWRAAREVAARFPDLRVLVNNAAVLPRARAVTADGLELQLAVNHLAYLVMADTLRDVLRANAPARVVNVASEAHRRAAFDLSDPQAERRYHPRARYDATKLWNVLATRELARRLEGSGVTANALHPGVIPTGLLRSFLGLPAVARPMLRLLLASEDQGARTSIHVATSDEVAGTTGRYFKDRREVAPSAAALDDAAAAALWATSASLLADAGAPLSLGS